MERYRFTGILQTLITRAESGTQIQRNYASLYFNRLGERDIVREAYALGLIDEIQAFAR